MARWRAPTSRAMSSAFLSLSAPFPRATISSGVAKSFSFKMGRIPNFRNHSSQERTPLECDASSSISACVTRPCHTPRIRTEASQEAKAESQFAMSRCCPIDASARRSSISNARSFGIPRAFFPWATAQEEISSTFQEVRAMRTEISKARRAIASRPRGVSKSADSEPTFTTIGHSGTSVRRAFIF